MNILILNTSERTGGAAIAANRLMKALIDSGINVQTLVLNKQTSDKNIISIQSSFIKRKLAQFNFLWERWVIFVHSRFSRKNLFKVSIANTGFDISGHPLVKSADIIHIHWINQGFLSLNNIKKLVQTGKPIVWTMHDMWVCTGVCHYAWQCEKYVEQCGNCMFLNSNRKKDLSHNIFQKKQFLSKTNIQIVDVSSWLKGLAEKSILTKSLKISVIPNVIDTSVFIPLNKQMVRDKISFPKDKKIILMGAAKLNDPIKGFDYLRQALSLLKEKSNDLLLVLFGKIKGCDTFLSNLAVEYIFMDSIEDVSLIVRLYAAADVTVVPSHYETFGQTLIESMACGCPVVSFDNSGQTDIIDHKINGYLAKYQDAKDLADGIDWILFEADYQQLSQNAHRKAIDCYSEEIVAMQYMELYKNAINF
ncbi:MAG: glycosyltransferase family 4 protein [Dysgonamonadaceae bacterium]|jgi:glycosyltransferase involved in cell wall biosynthesis|nr:glycosyltransferase family 4 protein [Dysgonamonadaceae bacterium]